MVQCNKKTTERISVQGNPTKTNITKEQNITNFSLSNATVSKLLR